MSPTITPCAFSFSISGVVSSSLTTIGGQVRPRVSLMKRVCVPLPAPGRAAEQDHLLRKAQVLHADFFGERVPDGFEDQARVFDFEIERLRGLGGGGR